MAWIAFTAVGVAVTPWLVRRVYRVIDSWNQARAEDNRD